MLFLDPHVLYVYMYFGDYLIVLLCVLTTGDHVLSNNKAMFMSPLQLHCVGRRMTLPIASSGGSCNTYSQYNVIDFDIFLLRVTHKLSTLA